MTRSRRQAVKTLAVMLLFCSFISLFAVNVQAQNLISQGLNAYGNWCKYSDGTVLSLGSYTCPMSIDNNKTPSSTQLQFVRQWMTNSGLMCQYHDGTVLNVGSGPCPLY